MVVWETLDEDWEDNFAQLVQFQKQTGHCNIPSQWPDNPKLASWIGNQRQNKKNGVISKERIKRLNDIGFVWDTRDATWEESFAQLVQFQRQTGHYNVPNRWLENPKLGIWVANQRQRKGRGQLSKERINRLEDIGFEWCRSKQNKN